MYFLVYILWLMLVVRPPGVFEFENFAKGTRSMMDAIVAATAAGTTTIIGLLIELMCIFHSINLRNSMFSS